MTDLDKQLEKILAQAFTDGASDTMWQNDRHIEIYATALNKLKKLILDARIDELNLWIKDFEQDVVHYKEHPKGSLKLKPTSIERYISLSSIQERLDELSKQEAEL